MEMVLICILVFLLLLFIGLNAYRMIEDERKRKKASCIVYIMRIDSSGKVEIKRSPEQLWTWKF